MVLMRWNIITFIPLQFIVVVLALLFASWLGGTFGLVAAALIIAALLLVG